MKIAIVGAGVAGLASIRRALEFGIDCVAYEVSENIGGTWVYEDVHNECQSQFFTKMYESLRTNLPTVTMQFRGYKFQPKSGECYPGRAEVQEYIEDFARNFSLKSYIKFSHKVVKISLENEKWTITVKNLKNDQFLEQQFDGVMVCSGQFSRSNYPSFPGMDTFPGHQTHSCNYRRNDFYKNKIVLMIGKGSSAQDLCREVARVANKVFLSHRGRHLNIPFENIIQKPNIVKIDKYLIFFEDGTTESVEAIIYCTGYRFEYPFLDPSCEITTKNDILTPLYKYFINAKHPTMCINGLLKSAMLFSLLDVQAEVFVKILTGDVKLPSTEEMLLEVQKEYEEKIKANIVGQRFYFLGSTRHKYFEELYNLGCCEPLPQVIFDVYDNNMKYLSHDFDNLRNQVYEVIDNCIYKFRMKGEHC